MTMGTRRCTTATMIGMLGTLVFASLALSSPSWAGKPASSTRRVQPDYAFSRSDARRFEVPYRAPEAGLGDTPAEAKPAARSDIANAYVSRGYDDLAARVASRLSGRDPLVMGLDDFAAGGRLDARPARVADGGLTIRSQSGKVRLDYPDGRTEVFDLQGKPATPAERAALARQLEELPATLAGQAHRPRGVSWDGDNMKVHFDLGDVTLGGREPRTAAPRPGGVRRAAGPASADHGA